MVDRPDARGLIMNKRKIRSLAPMKLFIHRILINMSLGLTIFAFSLGVGIIGYSYFEGMTLVDAYENAAMILSGMGPADTIKTTGGKIFAGTYAIFSGTIFLVVFAIIIIPIFHRVFHHFLIKILED